MKGMHKTFGTMKSLFLLDFGENKNYNCTNTLNWMGFLSPFTQIDYVRLIMQPFKLRKFIQYDSTLSLMRLLFFFNLFFYCSLNVSFKLLF